MSDMTREGEGRGIKIWEDRWEKKVTWGMKRKKLRVEKKAIMLHSRIWDKDREGRVRRRPKDSGR